MFEELTHLLHLSRLSGRALIDIVVLAILVYQLLLLIRGTRAVQMLLGILSLAIAYYLTGPDHLLELPAVHRVLGGALFFIPFVVVVLFQNHIRRVLASFGSNPLRGLARPSEDVEQLADEVVLAVTSLASHRHGALIVLEREQGLRTFAETGIGIDSLVSYDLLTTIFLPRSPLHDGAVIIGEGRIRAASCYLPLTSRPKLTKQFGSRHRAAIGITEETDAAAIVVSEERGTVALAREGSIHEDVGAGELREALSEFLAPPKPRLGWLSWGSARRKAAEPAPASDASPPPPAEPAAGPSSAPAAEPLPRAAKAAEGDR
jgi:uncharacterized protein (TIGR00159 family)